jgi:hypothetical protein
MFTIKFYSGDGFRQVIEEADSFTILRSVHDEDGSAEITLHRKSGESVRRDIGDESKPLEAHWPPRFNKAIIENSAGKTTEIIGLPGPRAVKRLQDDLPPKTQAD